MLLVVAVIGVLTFGSVLVAAQLGKLGDDDPGDSAAATQATTTSATTPTGTPGAVTPTLGEGSGVPASPSATGESATPTPVDVGEVNNPKKAAEAYAEV